MPIVCPERTLEAEGDFTWTRESVGDAFRDAFRALRSAIARPETKTVIVLSGIPGSGKSTWAAQHDADDVVIWDACCLTKPARKAVLTTIRNIDDKVPVVCVRFEVDFATCVARNAAREGRRRVPDGAMFRARRNFLMYPPSVAEGFARVLRPDAAGHIAGPTTPAG